MICRENKNSNQNVTLLKINFKNLIYFKIIQIKIKAILKKMKKKNIDMERKYNITQWI